jgi:hypothetical protein
MSSMPWKACPHSCSESATSSCSKLPQHKHNTPRPSDPLLQTDADRYRRESRQKTDYTKERTWAASCLTADQKLNTPSLNN